ncbi:Uncharacterised protein [Acinetobacter baumannii]|nr:Uncharacterised protein [Acinetobacter baumannii]
MIMKINIISKIHIIYSIFGYTSLQDLHHIYIIQPCLKSFYFKFIGFWVLVLASSYPLWVLQAQFILMISKF